MHFQKVVFKPVA